MPKGKGRKRNNINFRQTHSERSATNSYRGFGRYQKQIRNTKSEILNKFK